jgi:hypothetical protein
LMRLESAARAALAFGLTAALHIFEA